MLVMPIEWSKPSRSLRYPLVNARFVAVDLPELLRSQAGSPTLEAAEQVVADQLVAAPSVVDVLDALVARSMVALDETSLRRVMSCSRRCANMREHIEASGDSDVLRARHAAHFVAFSPRGRGLLGPDDETWAVRVEADLENLRAAFTWAIDTGNVDLAVGIPAPLWYRAFNTPQWGIGRWGEEAAALAGLDEHPDARTVLAVAISSHAMLGDLAEAQRYFDRVLALERQQGLSPDAASRTAMLSVAAMDANLRRQSDSTSRRWRQQPKRTTSPSVSWPKRPCRSFAGLRATATLPVGSPRTLSKRPVRPEAQLRQPSPCTRAAPLHAPRRRT